MALPKILVTGATGRTGGMVVSELLRAGYPVRAMVRRNDARAVALHARGVEIAVADMGDAERVAAAMRGVQRAYWLPPYDPGMLAGAAVFASAASEAKLESIVSLTQWLASPTHPALLTRHHWLADKIFKMVPDIALTFVNPGFFADTPYLSTIGMSAHIGMMPWMFGDTVSAPPSIDDIARVVVAALTDPDRHAGQSYRPTGPALLSGEDMAAVLTRVLGRKVRPLPTPLWLFLKAAHLYGEQMALLGCLEHYIEEHRRGAFAINAPNGVIERVTGRPAETFETVARRMAALPENQRSTSRTLREFARFMALPMARVPSVKRYMSGLQIVSPAAPQYVAESAVWRHEHGVSEMKGAAAKTQRFATNAS